MKHNHTLTRRGFIRSISLVGLVCATGASLSSLRADEATQTIDVEALIAKDMGKGPIAMEKVALEAPDTAENGSMVRVAVKVDHPQTSDLYIQSMVLYVDNNPIPRICQVEFTPALGVVQWNTRIRMAKSSKVRVIAKNNQGQLFGTVKEIQVATGGCAG